MVWFLNCTNSKHLIFSDLHIRCITKYFYGLELLFYSIIQLFMFFSGVSSNRRAAILNDVISRYCLFRLSQHTWCLSFRKTTETYASLVPNLKISTFCMIYCQLRLCGKAPFWKGAITAYIFQWLWMKCDASCKTSFLKSYYKDSMSWNFVCVFYDMNRRWMQTK